MKLRWVFISFFRYWRYQLLQGRRLHTADSRRRSRWERWDSFLWGKFNFAHGENLSKVFSAPRQRCSQHFKFMPAHIRLLTPSTFVLNCWYVRLARVVIYVVLKGRSSESLLHILLWRHHPVEKKVAPSPDMSFESVCRLRFTEGASIMLF